MSRSVPEWIGKTPDTPPPPRVVLRIWERCDGRCQITGKKIYPGDKWQIDHIRALINGGENRESNLQLVLSAAHKVKTAADVAEKSAINRKRARHIGARAPSRNPIPGSKASGLKKKLNGEVVRR